MPIPEPIYQSGQNLAFTRQTDTFPAKLNGHARTMEQGVYQVAEHFYVAVGYGCANMTMVVGTDGVLLIDCLETEEAARQALGDLRQFSDTPIQALIYSHSHPNHTSGARGLLDPSEVEHGRLGGWRCDARNGNPRGSGEFLEPVRSSRGSPPRACSAMIKRSQSGKILPP